MASDNLGGAERVSLNLTEELARSGRYDWVHCFFLRRNQDAPLHLEQVAAMPNVKLHYGGRHELFGVPALIWFLLRYRFELVFSSFSHLNSVASGMRRFRLLRTRRLVARESTLIFERRLANWVRRLLPLMYWLYGSQELIICQTSRMRDSLLRHQPRLPRRLIEVIPNPVQLNYEAGLPCERLEGHIAWCGRLIDVKEPSLALQVLALLPGNFRLHIIGQGPLRSQLEEQSRSLGLANRVIFEGWSDRPAEIFARCEYGLLTSRIEGFPNVVLEMLAAGVRGVVTTPCAGDLDQLAGVGVSTSHEAVDLVEAFEGLRRNLEVKDAVRIMLDARSIGRFADRIAGEGIGSTQ